MDVTPSEAIVPNRNAGVGISLKTFKTTLRIINVVLKIFWAGSKEKVRNDSRKDIDENLKILVFEQENILTEGIDDIVSEVVDKDTF